MDSTQNNVPRIKVPTKTKEELGYALANHVHQSIEAELSSQELFHLAVSGGSTPAPFFEALARIELPWERVHIWFCDERSVPPEHEDSNYRLLKTHLLDHLETAPIVHRMQGEAKDLPAEARRYDRLLAETVPEGLDYVALGMGDDGHTASLFPEGEEPEGRCGVTQHPDGSQRLSLSSDFINQSHIKALLIQGENKKNVLTHAKQDGNSNTFPILRVIDDTMVFN